jgi:hypothetical protein
MREYYAHQLINGTNLELAWAHVNANNVGTVIPDTQLWFARSAEYAAQNLYQYQTINGLAHTYNASYVIQNSLVGNDSLADLWQTMSNYNTAFSSYTGLGQQFISTYGSMEWGIGTGTSQDLIVDSTGDARIQLLTYMDLGSGSHWTEMAANQPFYLINTASSASGAN